MVKRTTKNDVSRARRIFNMQKQRCTNKKIREYRWYGARGIKQEYSLNDFIVWYLQRLQSFTGKTPSCDRIDSKKNYNFENIRMVELSENIKSRNKEHGNPGVKNRKPILILDFKTKDKLMLAQSTVEAARLCSTFATTISAICGGRRQYTRTGYTFSFYKGTM